MVWKISVDMTSNILGVTCDILVVMTCDMLGVIFGILDVVDWADAFDVIITTLSEGIIMIGTVECTTVEVDFMTSEKLSVTTDMLCVTSVLDTIWVMLSELLVMLGLKSVMLGIMLGISEAVTGTLFEGMMVGTAEVAIVTSEKLPVIFDMLWVTSMLDTIWVMLGGFPVMLEVKTVMLGFMLGFMLGIMLGTLLGYSVLKMVVLTIEVSPTSVPITRVAEGVCGVVTRGGAVSKLCAEWGETKMEKKNKTQCGYDIVNSSVHYGM